MECSLCFPLCRLRDGVQSLLFPLSTTYTSPSFQPLLCSDGCVCVLTPRAQSRCCQSSTPGRSNGSIANSFLAFFSPKNLKVLLTGSRAQVRPAYATLCKPGFHALGQPYLHKKDCSQELKRFQEFLTMRIKNQTTFYLVETDTCFPTFILYLKTQSPSQASLGLLPVPGVRHCTDDCR